MAVYTVYMSTVFAAFSDCLLYFGILVCPCFDFWDLFVPFYFESWSFGHVIYILLTQSPLIRWHCGRSSRSQITSSPRCIGQNCETWQLINCFCWRRYVNSIFSITLDGLIVFHLYIRIKELSIFMLSQSTFFAFNNKTIMFWTHVFNKCMIEKQMTRLDQRNSLVWWNKVFRLAARSRVPFPSSLFGPKKHSKFETKASSFRRGFVRFVNGWALTIVEWNKIYTPWN